MDVEKLELLLTKVNKTVNYIKQVKDERVLLIEELNKLKNENVALKNDIKHLKNENLSLSDKINLLSEKEAKNESLHRELDQKIIEILNFLPDNDDFETPIEDIYKESFDDNRTESSVDADNDQISEFDGSGSDKTDAGVENFDTDVASDSDPDMEQSNDEVIIDAFENEEEAIKNFVSNIENEEGKNLFDDGNNENSDIGEKQDEINEVKNDRQNDEFDFNPDLFDDNSSSDVDFKFVNDDDEDNEDLPMGVL